MLNILWPIFIIISIIYAIFSGNLENLNKSIFGSTESAVNLTLTLLIYFQLLLIFFDFQYLNFHQI